VFVFASEKKYCGLLIKIRFAFQIKAQRRMNFLAIGFHL
jgi:hypothetical protein